VKGVKKYGEDGKIIMENTIKPGELTADDKAVWKKITKTIAPLENRPPAKPLAKIKPHYTDHHARELPMEWQLSKGPVPETHIDRKTQRRLSSGHKDIDRVIDLHGNTSDVAYARLKREIVSSIKLGHRCLLIITGKGGKRVAQAESASVPYRKRDDFDSGTGVLKRLVPEWLKSAELSPFVISYDSAHKSHGGDGALYVMLRNKAPKGYKS
jgi:DNA-nicking Smr family endonuclease